MSGVNAVEILSNRTKNSFAIIYPGTKMSIQKTSAFVLKSINWKDASKITTLFTRELGKVNVIAKGAKRMNSPYRGLLESLNLLDVYIYFSPKRDLQTLGDINLENSFNSIRGSLLKIGYALSILELVESFFDYGNPDITFFDFSKQIFYNLDESDDEQVIFWYYLLKLASYLGFKPEFLICRSCGKQIGGNEVNFSMSEGSVLCSSCLPFGKNIFKIIKSDLEILAAIQQTPYKKAARIKAGVVRQLNFTDFLLQYIQFHTGQKLELSSLKLLKSIK